MPSDYPGVGCDDYRGALSARLDDEDPPPGAPADVDAHLAGCAACRRWLGDAATVNRLVRTGSLLGSGTAVAGVDVTAAVLPAAPGRWRGRLVLALRVVLAGFGVAQLVLGLLQVTLLRGDGDNLHGTTVDGAAPGHLWHESAAWNIAIGAAFLWVAARRGRPVGIVPILTVFIAVLVLLSSADLLAGDVSVTRVTSHGFVLVGYLVVLALSRTQLDFAGPGQARQRRSDRIVPAAPLPDNVRQLPRRGQPAAEARHRAAA